VRSSLPILVAPFKYRDRKPIKVRAPAQSQAAALLTIIQTDNAPILFVACAVFGSSIGNLITLPPLIIHREFDAAAFTKVMGLSGAVTGITSAFGPALVGLVHSLNGDYIVALGLCITLELVAAMIVLFGGQKHDISTSVQEL